MKQTKVYKFFDQVRQEAKKVVWPERKELIEAASVIIWDESPSNEYHCFKTVYEYFNSFNGKVVILSGDWKQTPPVVKYGSVSDIIKASIINSPIWHVFNIFKLFKTNT